MKKWFILFFITSSFLTTAFAANLSALKGTYQAKDFQIKILDNGQQVEIMMPNISKTTYDVQPTENDDHVFMIKGFSGMLILTGQHALDADCSADKLQNIVIMTADVRGVQLNCLVNADATSE